MTGEEIARLRKSLKLTQAEFAERLGVHKVTVSKWENDQHAPRGLALRALLALARPPISVKLAVVTDLESGTYFPHIWVREHLQSGHRDRAYASIEWGLFRTPEEARRFGEEKIPEIIATKYGNMEYEYLPEQPS